MSTLISSTRNANAIIPDAPALPKRRSTARWREVAAVLLIALAIWLPRGLALDRFATADEHAWLARSTNFARALHQREWAITFQREHPGVAVMWAGALGLAALDPGAARDAPAYFNYVGDSAERYLATRDIAAIDGLAAMRAVAVLLITLALALAFWFATRLLGGWPAAVGFLLLALDPFHVGLSRLLHLDGLLSSFMLLALLAFLHGWLGTRRWPRVGSLLVSGVAAGLAWLTRSPGLFLGPFLALVVATSLLRPRWQQRHPARAGQAITGTSWRAGFIALGGWTAVGLATVVLLWPAMWVDPAGSVGRVLGAASSYAAEGHLKPVFFNGQIFSGDPGALFYPLAYLWRTTPVTLLGLGLATVAVLHPRSPLDGRARRTAAVLALFALGFAAFMSLGAKKFDRYLLPAFPALDLVAGIGWVALAQTISSGLSGSSRFQRIFENSDPPSSAQSARSASYLLLAVVIALQITQSLPTFPYYLSYYNPLLGNPVRDVQIGWGEGADQAARWLRDEADAAGATVASAYTSGPFDYFFPGSTVGIYSWHEADYAVLYAQDFQRRLPAPRQIAHFETLPTAHSVRLNGIDYARVYNLRDAPLPVYVTDWGTPDEALFRLVSYQFPGGVLQPGETLPLKLYLTRPTPAGERGEAENFNIVVRLVDQAGGEVARSEGWPHGAPTSEWPPGATLDDAHALPLPADASPGYYRVEIGFYGLASETLLTATRPLDEAVLGNFAVLDYVRVGDVPAPEQVVQPRAVFGEGSDELAALIGWELRSGAGDIIQPDAVPGGEPVRLRLFWRAHAPMTTDYTIFTHVVDADGQMVAQVDAPPLGGFLPTSLWHTGEQQSAVVVDERELVLPASATGSQLFVGLYDFESGVRLQIVEGDEAVVGQDALLLTTLAVE